MAGRRPNAVVALGASAGGIESLGRLLEGLPRGFPVPVLVALHLDPHHRSQVVALLQQRTRMRVLEARSGAVLTAGTVFVAPPDRHLEVAAGCVRLTHGARVNYSRPSIDVLFSSVAAAYGPAAIVAILSGTGHDGSEGLAAVKARGGVAVAEASSTAGFAGMPEAAERTGLLDAVLPIGQIPAFLARAAAHRVTISARQWSQMLALLEAKTGARFSKYRSTSLQRRLQQRLAARGCRTMGAYLRLLRKDDTEAGSLQAAFLIKVSAFQRDPAAWRALAQAVPSLAKGTHVRAWSAGCATGEEAYTMALLLANELHGRVPWKVFATDLDEGALKVARVARYTDRQLRGMAKDDLARHFVREPGGWRVGKALRSRVVFGKHDLLHDPPLSGIDLLACRNVLIYFTPEVRERTLAKLSLAVKPGGILFLGRTEGLRPVPGFDRVGHTTFFRRTALPSFMPRRKRAPHDDDPDAEIRDVERTAADGPGADGVDADGVAGNGPAVPRGKALEPKDAVRGIRKRNHPGSDEARLTAQQDLNEELQSRNEELETVNEELQSLNDELSTMEEQMRGLEAESRRSNDFLRLLLDTSADVLIACDADNRVTFWNKAAIKSFRLSPAQAVGGELFDLVPALAKAALRAASRKVRAPGRGGRVLLRQGDATYILDPVSAGTGKRRGYLLRIRAET